jgi:hypothetical protein
MEQHVSEGLDDPTPLEGFITDPRFSIVMFDGDVDEAALKQVGGFRAYTSSAEAVGDVPAVVFAMEPQLANLQPDSSSPPTNSVAEAGRDAIAQRIEEYRLGEPDAFETYVADYGLEMEVVDGFVHVYDPDGGEIRESVLGQDTDDGFVNISIE